MSLPDLPVIHFSFFFLLFDSVEEWETIVCFLEDQEIMLFPKNTQYPPVDFRSSGSAAQSASENAIKVTEPELKN